MECIGSIFMPHPYGEMVHLAMIVFVEKDPTLPGFQGLFVAQVLLFFSFHYRNVYYPCALVQWFTPIGSGPCAKTGMWIVEHEYDEFDNHLVNVIHLDSIL